MLSFSCKLVHVYLSVRGILSLLTMKTLILNATLCSISSGSLLFARVPSIIISFQTNVFIIHCIT